MRAIDPVCGMEVDARNSGWKLTLGEECFYFCSPTCMRTFEENAEAVLDLKKLHRAAHINPGTKRPSKIEDGNRPFDVILPGGGSMLNDSECHVEPVLKKTSPGEARNLSTITLAITGMGCPNCANRVRNSLLMLGGVIEADIDHNSGEGIVRYNTEMVNPLQLTWAVAAAGGDGRHEYAASFE